MRNILLSFVLFFVSVLPAFGNSASALSSVINFNDFTVLPAVDPSIVVRQRQIEKSISITISEVSQKKGDFGGLLKQLPGQGTKFKQASHTAEY